MGRTIPSFRIALEMEKADWKPFHNALDKSDRKKFDEMFDIPRFYTSACSYAVQPIRLYPILMSILLYDYQQLAESISQVEKMLVKVQDLQKVQRDYLQPSSPEPPRQQGQSILSDF
jgi:hypothetical protein